jgi:putative alpha-1,2-mannosidase
MPGWNFDAALASARSAWDDVLDRLQLDPVADGDAGERQLTALRLAQYRVLARYGDITDRDGRYRAADGSVRRMPAGTAYIGNLDLDREHGEVLPLLDLLVPGRMPAFTETLLAHQVATGRLPSRTAWGRNAGGHAPHAPLLTLAGLVSRASRGVDPERVLPPMVKPGQLYGGDLPWDAYLPLGYFPADRAVEGGVRLTLQAARAHHSVALVAAAVGDEDVAGAYAAQAVLYRQLWDEQARTFRPRDSHRQWTGPDPAGHPGPVRGASAEQWIPGRFDIDGLLGLLGGRQALADALGAWLDMVGATGQGTKDAGMGEVPGYVPWLYFFSNDPAAGLRAVRQWQEHARIGESDVARSAELLFAALGLFPVLDTAGEYLLAAPGVAQARIRWDGGQLVVNGRSGDGIPGAGMITLDGTPLPGRTVDHRRLARGGELDFGGTVTDRLAP